MSDVEKLAVGATLKKHAAGHLLVLAGVMAAAFMVLQVLSASHEKHAQVQSESERRSLCFRTYSSDHMPKETHQALQKCLGD